MNKSSQNFLVAFVTGVGVGILAGFEYVRVKSARAPFNPSPKNPWRFEDEDEELQEWLAELKGKSLEELKEIQKDLLYETNVDAKEIALGRIILSIESEEFNKSFEKTAADIRETQKKTSDRIARFRKEMDSNDEI
jgi:hypothetical protein